MTQSYMPPGFVYDYGHELSYHLRVNVVLYDYTGYGLSTGAPSELGCYADIESVFTWLVERCHVPVNRILAYGRSLGTGPSVHLATKNPLAGVIIQSGFASIYKAP